MERAFISLLDNDVFEVLESYSPREVKRLLLRAMANAALRKQQNFSVDFAVTIGAEDLLLPETTANAPMGFIW